MKKIGLCFFSTILIILIIPGVISFAIGTEQGYSLTRPLSYAMEEEYYDDYTEDYDSYTEDYAADSSEPVFSSEQADFDTGAVIGLEPYICGVVAAEMPASFETEALKAQAVAARTYAYRRLTESGGNDAKIALTNEDIAAIDQAFLNDESLKKKWGSSYEENRARIINAVESTKGEIMIYDDIPIEAVFHATSAGMTENAENVWQKEYPYLKSVASAEELQTEERIFENKELLDMLRESFGGLNLTDAPFLQQLQIVERSDAGYVETVILGDKTLTGRQIRTALGLKSTSFTVKEADGKVIFMTKGYGHGVGMSQYGANAMAQRGYGYIEILKHYYNGVAVTGI